MTEEKPSLIILNDGAKVLNGVLIPTKKNLKKWITKNHPEYLEDCEQNGEFLEIQSLGGVQQ